MQYFILCVWYFWFIPFRISKLLHRLCANICHKRELIYLRRGCKWVGVDMSICILISWARAMFFIYVKVKKKVSADNFLTPKARKFDFRKLFAILQRSSFQRLFITFKSSDSLRVNRTFLCTFFGVSSLH